MLSIEVNDMVTIMSMNVIFTFVFI